MVYSIFVSLFVTKIFARALSSDGHESFFRWLELSRKGSTIPTDNFLHRNGVASSAINIDLASLTPNQGAIITGEAVNSRTSYSLRVVDDINGDGKDEILIGAPTYLSNTGIVYLVYGNSLSDIDLSNLGNSGITITGAGENYYTGWSVSKAGDVNGDGIMDILIGAPGYDSYTGIVYLIYGKGSMGNIDLSNIAGNSNVVTFTGAGQNYYTGWSVSTAQNFDGSNNQDMIIGAPGYDSNRGCAYIVKGKSGLTSLNLGSLGGNGVTINGAEQGYFTGWSVSNAGDINKDGTADVIVGAYGYEFNTGAAYIIYGPGPADTINLSDDLWSSTGATIKGTAQGCYTGWSVSSIGDINADGVNDIAIGAYGCESNAGMAYIVFGNSKTNLAEIDLSNLGKNGVTISGAGTGYKTGWSVSYGGKINDDDVVDMLIGAPGYADNTGMVYLIFGGSSLQNNIDLANLQGEQGVSFTGPGINSSAGYALCYAKFNNDDYHDVVIGAPEYSSNTGIGYIVYGSVSGVVTNVPTMSPTMPTSRPTSFPTVVPSAMPTSQPASTPTGVPTRPYNNIYNFNVETAIYSTIASLVGGVMIYLAPSFILGKWGYKYRYVYTDKEKDELKEFEIGLCKNDTNKIVALHKRKGAVDDFVIEANDGNNHGISLGLYDLIIEQLDRNPSFRTTSASSFHKYIYSRDEANNLQNHEIGIEFSGVLPWLSWDIFFNLERLTVFKRIDNQIISKNIKMSDRNYMIGISRTLYHSIASEYYMLSGNNIFTTYEKSQLNEFLLVPGRVKPSISVLQKTCCLYTPIFFDLGKAPGFFHNILNCNGYGPEIFYDIITFNGFIPGFMYGVCYMFFRKYQVGMLARLSDDLFVKLATCADSAAESETDNEFVKYPIASDQETDVESPLIGAGSMQHIIR